MTLDEKYKFDAESRLLVMGRDLQVTGPVEWEEGVARIRLRSQLRRGWLVVTDSHGEWVIRAAIEIESGKVKDRVLRWLVFHGQRSLGERKLEAKLRLQVKSLTGFEYRSRRLTSEGMRVAGLAIDGVGMIGGAGQAVLARRWLATRPWTTGCAWDWWRIAARDLEGVMEEQRVGAVVRWTVRARLYGAFESVLRTMEG